MARIRAIRKDGDSTVTLWTPKKGGRAPAPALWEVTVSLGRDAAGHYRQRTERVRGTYTNAKDKAAAMEASVGKVAVEEPRRTLSEAIELYIRYAETVKGRASKTIIGYESIARTVALRVGAVELRRLTGDDLDGYYTWLSATRGVSPTTVAHHHMLISQTLNMAVRRKWMAGPSPAESADPPSIEQPRPYAPSPEDARAFIAELAADEGTRSRAALLFLAGVTGCRRGEVAGWRWSDFDREGGALAVHRSITVGKAGPTEKRTKTKRERRIAFNAGTVAILADQWDRYAQACHAAGLSPDMESFVFSDDIDHARPLNPNSVTQAFRRLRARMVAAARAQAALTEDQALRTELERRAERLGRVQLKHFRSFAATQMAAARIDIKTASARMGHDGNVFMRHYAAVIDSNDQEAGLLLEKALLPALGAG